MSADAKRSSVPAGRRFYAATTIAFPRVSAFLPDILDSIATHDMQVVASDGRYIVSAAFGVATVEAGEGTLALHWSGGITGPSLPNDLRELRWCERMP